MFAMRSFLLFTTGLVVLASVMIAVWSLQVNKEPPSINGTYVQPSHSLDHFELVDHQGRPFTNKDLQGQWHFVSYGFTHCPDVCPMTLLTLSRVQKLLEESGAYTDVGTLFYTVDSKRDTVEALAKYVPYFHEDFLGLTHNNEENTYQSFEQGLGIKAFIDQTEKRENPENYGVSHGIKLYLLNAQGELQAVFEPEVNQQGMRDFSVESLYTDYLAIRDYAEQTGNRVMFWAE